VGLVKGALVVRYRSTNPESIERIAEELRKMGLAEGGLAEVRRGAGSRARWRSDIPPPTPAA